jgi:Acetyltransferases
MVTLRVRKPSDDKELVRLIRAELIPLSHTARPLDARIVRELPLRFRRGVTYVAVPSKYAPPAGFVHFEVLDSQLMIHMLVTNPMHRRRGIGQKLMQWAEAFGATRQCGISRLYVDLANVSGQRFYAKLGYRAVRYVPDMQLYELIKPLPLPVQS